jgi:glycosyltransferase involved in cell wall biosynthesis
MIRNVSVSVVIPHYNDFKNLLRAIDSVEYQTVLPKEIIIIDDCSSDKFEKKILKEKKYSFKIKIIFNKINLGPASSRNIGWNISNSRYVAFLDSDDTWHPRKIEIQYNFMKKKKLNFTAHYSTTDYDNTFDSWSSNIKFSQVNKIELLLYNKFTTPTVMLKKKIKFRFPEKKYYIEDYNLWLIIIFNNIEIYLIKKTLTYLHKPSIGFSGLSKDLQAMRKGERDAYRDIYEKKLINYITFLSVLLFSFIKNIRRNLFLK